MTSPFFIALSHFSSFGPRTYVRLFKHFPNAETLWQATAPELAHCGVREKIAQSFVTWRKTIQPTLLEEQLLTAKLQAVDCFSDHYPALLKTIHDPPLVLYYKGTLPQTQRCIAMVGSRYATSYGIHVAEQFSQDLSARGITIVSGLAYGIDDAAHKGALAHGGKTTAVVASGLLKLPSTRYALTEDIVHHGGAIVSEYPPHTPAEKFHFPVRNRIIAGMSHGTVIVEAGLPSGSLITAQVALNEGRDVFAVPGPITSPSSKGTNQLLKDGAHLASSAEDILNLYGMSHESRTPSTPPSSDNPTEAAILVALSTGSQHVDNLARQCNLLSSTLLSTLTMMEIHGKVRHLGNMHYCLP